MTFTASVAAGDNAVTALRALHESGIARGRVSFITHGDLAIAWSEDCRWIDSHDDGNLLILIDGHLHDPPVPRGRQAEMLATRYQAKGIDFATGLLGDFVVIVLDRMTAHLSVSRDPLGVRPWFLATSGNLHSGASDLATLASLPWVQTEVDEPVVIEYLAARSQSRGPTFYRGIRTLRPGETWHRRDQGARTFRHHRWNLQPDPGISFDDAAERCRVLLDEAVRCRLHAGEPATSELSGGLDSSSVVGTIAKLGWSDLAVGRLLFDTPRADERFYSDAVVAHWGIPAVSSPPWLPTPEEGWELTRRLQRPVPDPHFTMFTGLHRLLLQHGRPAGLTGLGGDDAFVSADIASRALSAVYLRQGRVLRELFGGFRGQPSSAWREVVKPTLHRLAPWKGARLPPWISNRAANEAGLPQRLREHSVRVTGIPAIDFRIQNLTTGYDAFVLETAAIVNDEAGRRQSHPYLDPRFIEATYGLDPSWPSRGGHTRALQVAAYRDRLPPAVATRRSKVEFSEIFWPQVLVEEILRAIRTGPLAERGWLDDTGFEELTLKAQRGMATAAIPLSRCVSVDRWLRSL
ncbi:MAG TPA: asparagine synthase-related protein [Acidimicrobiia bacterium]|nr:asparagine synthase-related protein [Acidimicrobiia bacterium]